MNEMPRHPGPFLMRPEDADASAAQLLTEAGFWEALGDGRVACRLCPRGCVLGEGQRGSCGVRENLSGTLYTLVHSRVCAAQVDAIEKKPLFHFLPGTAAFSIATAGCNLHCSFCQNWDIAQVRPEEVAADFVPPERVVEMARQCHCPTIAFTYNEPSIFAEYLIDTADAARAAGLRCVAVSNGYVHANAVADVYGRLDAVKIDVKAFSESFYKNVAGGALLPVLNTLTTLRAMGKWIEIVYLIIPTLNDSDGELRALATWIKANLGSEVPLHFTRYHPAHRLVDLPPTPVATLDRAKEIALAEGLQYIYVGNFPGHAAQDTFCPRCGQLLVERIGFKVTRFLVDAAGTCPFCAHTIPGIWRI